MENKTIQWKAVRKTEDLSLLGEVEIRYGIEYPELYAKIVWENNAGVPERSNFMAAGYSECVFGRLISVRREDNPNILGAAAWLEKEDPRVCRIPFAVDPFGNMLCFRFQENGVCMVVMIDHETNREVYLADTFEEFLDMLY